MNHLVQAIHMILEGEERRGEEKRGYLYNFIKISGQGNDQVNIRVSLKYLDELTLRTIEVTPIN